MVTLRSLLIVSVLASACASVPLAAPEKDLAAKEFRTSPGQSNVYVFRDESMGAAVKMTVLLDDKLLGDTAAKTFLLTTVRPGKHALMSKTENDARVEFTAEAGRNVYVWQEVKMGVLSARSALHLLDEASARERIKECKLADVGQAAPADDGNGVPRS